MITKAAEKAQLNKAMVGRRIAWLLDGIETVGVIREAIDHEYLLVEIEDTKQQYRVSLFDIRRTF